MQSLIHLYNIALSKLGGEQIVQNSSSLEHDTVGEICQNIFPHVLDVALESHAWSFALKRAELAKVECDRPIFALPSDCVKPVRILSDKNVFLADAHPEYEQLFTIEGQYLLCSCEHLSLLYVSRIKDPHLWPAYFSEYLIWVMAANLAPARNNDKQQQQMAEKMAEIALAKACAKDKAKQRAVRPRSAWSIARCLHGGR